MTTRLLTAVVLACTCTTAQDTGKRPYEMDWADRHKDEHEPLIDFEDLAGWRVETQNCEATFVRSREQQIWDKHVGKLSYRATDSAPELRILPPAPIRIEQAFDAVTCWIYGNNWAYVQDPTTPQVQVSALFQDNQGQPFTVPLTRVRWKEWYLCHRRLTPDQTERVAGGGMFLGFAIANARNKDERAIFLDNLAVFIEQFPPLTFEPRRARGIPMFPGQGTGTNTGPGKLPFPTRLKTILPDNLAQGAATSLQAEGDTFLFTYTGPDGRLTYRLAPQTGTLGDISARWQGRGDWFQPCREGGVFLQPPGAGVQPPSNAQRLSAEQQADSVVCRWQVESGELSGTLTYTFRLWDKTLVVDVVAPGGMVAEVRYGRAVGLTDPRLVALPYYTYGQPVRPAIVVAGPEATPLFLAGHTDWTLSNASTPWAENAVTAQGVSYNGGVRYTPKTDGQRNDCFERLFITVTPRFEETLPNIPNPVSPWKQVTGTRVWRAHGASNREHDAAYWRKCHRYGITQVVVTDHETGWRDGGESFTFRTRPAPGKGGDEGQRRYARIMQDELGFVYGPYNNFTDFCPVNEFWSLDLINRQPDNQLHEAWARCYAPKPARAVEYCAKLAPIIQSKFNFSTAYCDVHTAVTPWGRTDYDHRVPGAGTFAAVFYSYGEIMLLQKKAWDGPVYSEGNNHWLYCGLTDGNYAQDQRYKPQVNPWLVDFDLRKMHDLCCNFGMGNLGMFFGRKASLGRTRAEVDQSIDRFLAATVAFGHTGFLIFESGYHNALRSYYMLQQLHSRYALGSAERLRYVAADGRLLDSTSAVATGVYKRSQVVTRYSNGCVTVANGSMTERLVADVDGRHLDLPPNGYAGWTDDAQIEVISAEQDGYRCDYAQTPAYLYIDGRGRFTRFPKAAARDIGICRILPDNKYEIIAYGEPSCGFAIDAVQAVALDVDRKSMGPAELRRARGLTYVMPVEGAFSYLLDQGVLPAPVTLTAERVRVIPGERVAVQGAGMHHYQVPQDASAGDRLWFQAEDAWIDFTVVPLTDITTVLDGDTLNMRLRSNLPGVHDGVAVLDAERRNITLRAGQSTTVPFDLVPAISEESETLRFEVSVGTLRQAVDIPTVALADHVELARIPDRWQSGMRLRGQAEQFGFGTTRTHVHAADTTCNTVSKKAIAMHPPWVGGVGYAFALFEPVALPAEPPAAFRAVVGKGDGSDLGDGILYRVVVVMDGAETVAAERVVAEHAWLPIEADLEQWAGKTIQLKIVSDVGVDDNSSGDWACWADTRIESKEQLIVRTIGSAAAPFRTDPAPLPLPGLSRDDLRRAKRGWLRYDGTGLSGTGEAYGSFAVLNGVELGNMAPAGGSEVQGVWAENVTVDLTPDAIQALDFRNTFVLRNPRRDWFKVRRFWVEIELADGRRCSSKISATAFTQPPSWPYAEGIGVPHGEDITVQIWFPR